MKSPGRFILPLIFGVIALFSQAAESDVTGHHPPSTMGGDTLSVDFPDEDIENVINKIADLFKLDVRLPRSGIHGKTSIKLRDVTWRQIFNVTLSPVGYAFYERDGVVVILTQTELDALPAESRTVELYYQTPDEMTRFLSNLYPDRATFSTTATGLTFSTNPKHIRSISEEIARLDSPSVRLNPFPRPIFFPDAIPVLPKTANPTIYLNGTPEAGEDPMTTRILILEKVDAVAVSKYLGKNFARKNDRIMVDRRINAVIITAPESRVARLEAISTYLDDKRWYDPKNTSLTPPKDDFERQ
jgi:type II secretory pathway component GspD/PulD (secretin)